MTKTIDWSCSQGRHHLLVCGIVVATSGDICRDHELLKWQADAWKQKGTFLPQNPLNQWTGEMIKHVAEEAAPKGVISTFLKKWNL